MLNQNIVRCLLIGCILIEMEMVLSSYEMHFLVDTVNKTLVTQSSNLQWLIICFRNIGIIIKDENIKSVLELGWYSPEELKVASQYN